MNFGNLTKPVVLRHFQKWRHIYIIQTEITTLVCKDYLQNNLKYKVFGLVESFEVWKKDFYFICIKVMGFSLCAILSMKLPNWFWCTSVLEKLC